MTTATQAPLPSPRGRRAALVRILPRVSLAMAGWAAVVWATGGFLLEFGPIHFSSRSPRNPVILAAAGTVVSWLLLTPAERRRFWHRLGATADRMTGRMPPSAASWLAWAAVAFSVFLAVYRGLGSVGGSDTYGYVSESELWANGKMRIEEPLLRQVQWENAADILSPLGYRPAPDRQTIVPVYPPGLPLVMSVFVQLGGRSAVFYAVPLLGGLAVWATFILGSALGGRETGALGSVLLATSPAFVFQSLVAMTDVPVAAWWTLSLLSVASRRRSIAMVAGLAAGMGILTRPNLAPLAIAPAAVLLWRAVVGSERAGAWVRLALFGAGTAAGCVALGVINDRLYGSPFASGYGPIVEVYSLGNVWTNARLYFSWTIQSQTVLVACALLSPFALARHAGDESTRTRREIYAASVAIIVLTLASYLPYTIFDVWFWLRFLLPAWPALMALTALGLIWLSRRIVGRHGLIIAAAIVLAVGGRNMQFLKHTGTFTLKEGERKSPAIGRYVAAAMPERAAFLAMQQTGSVRYYSGRLSLRYDWINPEEFDRVVADLRRLGYHPYVLLEDWEEPYFRDRFKARSAAGALDWPPIVWLHHSTPIKIYDLMDIDRQKAEGRAPNIVF